LPRHRYLESSRLLVRGPGVRDLEHDRARFITGLLQVWEGAEIIGVGTNRHVHGPRLARAAVAENLLLAFLAVDHVHLEEVGGAVVERHFHLRVDSLQADLELLRPRWIDDPHMQAGVVRVAGHKRFHLAQHNALDVYTERLFDGVALPDDFPAERADIELMIAGPFAHGDGDAITRQCFAALLLRQLVQLRGCQRRRLAVNYARIRLRRLRL